MCPAPRPTALLAALTKILVRLLLLLPRLLPAAALLAALLILLVTRLLHPKIILHMSDARDALGAVLCATTLLTVIDDHGTGEPWGSPLAGRSEP